ncbi:MAG: hypothetical protein ACLRXB_01285 [Escherichia coli]
MNESGATLWLNVRFANDDWLFFPSIVPWIIRATTADERGNLTYEHEGAYLGPLEQVTFLGQWWHHNCAKRQVAAEV